MERSEKKTVLAIYALLAASGLLYSFKVWFPPLGKTIAGYLTAMAYMSLFLLWIISMRQRLLPFPGRKYPILSGFLMILWLLIRTFKYSLTGVGTPLNILLWYAYYIPQILLPLLFFLSSLYLGRRESWRPSAAWRLLYIPAVLLIAGVLTNNFHHLMFRFPPGFVAVQNEVYRHGPLYYSITVWCALLIGGGLFRVVRSCRNAALRQWAWLPLAWPCLFVLYLIYLTRGPLLLPSPPYQYPEAACLTMFALWESCIRTRLIPSNTDYDWFFTHASIPALITDDDGRVIYRSASAASLPPEKMEAAHTTPVLLGRDTRLSSKKLRSGWVYWTDDLSRLNRVNAALTAAAGTLAEETDLIAAENRLRRHQAHIRERTAIYETIAAAVRPQLDALHSLLDGVDPADPALPEQLSRASVYGAYIKRRANLMLLSSNGESIPAGELELSLGESMTYLHLCGVESGLTFALNGPLSADTVLCFYDFFQWAVEQSLPSLRAFLVRVERREQLFLRVTLESDEPLSTGDWLDIHPGRDVSAEEDGDARYLTLRVPLEGGAL